MLLEPGRSIRTRQEKDRAIVNGLNDFYASVEKIRGLAEENDAQVVFGHDAEQPHSLRRAPDGYDT